MDQALKPFVCVRVRHLRNEASSYDGWRVNQRPPQVGDFGTVLDVVDTRNPAINATYKIGDAAGMLAQLTLSRNGERAYLVGDQYVTVLSTANQDVLGSITVGDQPSCAVESPDGERLYIGDYAGTVTVLEIAADAARDALTSDDDWSAPRGWSFSELRTLEPTLA